MKILINSEGCFTIFGLIISVVINIKFNPNVGDFCRKYLTHFHYFYCSQSNKLIAKYFIYVLYLKKNK